MHTQRSRTTSILKKFLAFVVVMEAPLQAHAQEVEIIVAPTEARIDEPLSWQIAGLEPGQDVTITGQASDGFGSWRSEAIFTANADGAVEPSRTAPTSGSYEGVQPMGMVWSMSPIDQNASRFYNQRNYILKLSATIEDHIVASAEATRLSPRHSEQLIVTDINQDGVVGRLWRPVDDNQYPGVLYIGGSGGGLNDTEAAQLAQSGFIVLDLFYFGQGFAQDGPVRLPENLVRVPIEYFRNAADWLAAQNHVDPNHIGIYGHSRGTEAAILTAARYDTIKAVVIRSPSAVAWMGPGRAGFRKSAWSWHGKQVPFLNMGIRDGLSWLRKISRGDRAIVTRLMFERSLLKERRMRRALLPVDQMRAPILMISGEDDRQWPSSAMSELLVNQLEQAEYPYEYRHEMFKDAGHRPGIPFTPLPIEARQTFANGGTALGNVHAGVEGLSQTRAFFNKHLMTDEE